MKIAYLMQVRDDITQAAHTITALATYDDVYVTIYDMDEGRPLQAAFRDNENVHFINEYYEYMEGSLSVPRVWLLLLKEALDNGPYGAYINVTEYTLPLKSRTELIEKISADRKADYIQNESEHEVPGLRKKYQKMSVGPTDPRYQTDEKFRKHMKTLSNIAHTLHFRRKEIPFELLQGPVWFIMSQNTAEQVVENMQECSEHFFNTIFSEEVYFQSVMKKYSENLVNECIVLMHKEWVPETFSDFVDQPRIDSNKEKFFAHKVRRDDNVELYDEYIEKY